MANLRPNKNQIISKRFKDGANSTFGQERVGNYQEGIPQDRDAREFYYDFHNGRPSDFNYFGDISKLKGEDDSVFPLYAIDLDDSYSCIGMANCNDNVICFYASLTAPSTVVINGIIVCQSDEFLLTPDNHLQIDVNENCLGGEIYCTDNNISPFYFNVQDMIDSVDTEKYFTEFSFEDYTIGTEGTINHPVFVELVDVGAGAGLPTGRFQYAINFVDEAGNQSPLSYPTPLIFVPAYYSETENNLQYPFNKIRGQNPNPDSNTSYGIKIKFRIDNRFSYPYYQIIRVAFQAGEGIGFTPIAYVIKKVAITPNQFSVEEFIDSQSSSDTPEAITILEETGAYGNISKAQSIRYFNRRVVLANVEYTDVTTDSSVSYTDESNIIFPIVANIGTEGHDNAWNDAYRKSFTDGDRYGFAILFHDDFGRKFYAHPIEGYENFLIPNRRDEMSLSESISLSENPVISSSVDGNIIETFEVFELGDAVDRGKLANVSIVESGPTPYDTLEPVNVSDLNSDYDERICETVNVNSSTTVNFNPDIFAPSYRSIGVGFKGLESYPSWAKAFSIIRTQRAGRVIAQCLGIYALTAADPTGDDSNSTYSLKKSKTKLWIHSADIENGLVSIETISDIIANPTSYKVQLVSPVGFCSEVYSFNEDNWSPFGDDIDSCIDMAVHAVVSKEVTDKRCNDGDSVSDIGNYDGSSKGHIGYGKWRNNSNAAIFGAGMSNGNQQLDIVSLTEKVEYGGITYYEIQFSQEIYNYDNAGTNRDFDDNDQKNFQEPFYVLNIIKDVSVPDTNIVEYLMTEHYQKIESVIGSSSGETNQSFEIVDERLEDFFVEDGDTSTNKFIFIKNGGTFERWINITEKSAGDIILIEDDVDGGTSDYCGELIYGTYKATETEIYFDSDTYTPDEGSFIVVVYDNRYPSVVFGGDSYIGQALFCPINRQSTISGGTSDQFCLRTAFPYFQYTITDGVDIVKNADPLFGDPSIQSNRDCKIGSIRQMIILYVCIARTQLALEYNSVFPLVNYVYRPIKWDDSKSMSENGMSSDYISDYPDEISIWKRGGFRVTNASIINIDYSKEPYNFKFTSKPLVGFVNQLRFCTRVVWSLQKVLNDSNSPNLKTFLINNTYDISDHNGDIVYLYDDTKSGQANLYAICHEDISLLVTEKVLLSQLSGDQLSVIGQSGDINFIQQDAWLNADGCPDNLWLAISESKNALFFFNYNSFFKFSGGQVKDIGKELPYYNKLKKLIIDPLKENSILFNLASLFDSLYLDWHITITKLAPGGDITQLESQITIYDYASYVKCVEPTFADAQYRINNVPDTGTYEFYVSNKSEDYNIALEILSESFTSTIIIVPSMAYIHITVDDSSVSYEFINAKVFAASGGGCLALATTSSVIYSDAIQNWIGTSDYVFSKGTSFDGLTYTEKDLQIVQINSGYEIDGDEYSIRLRVQFAPGDWFDKKFIRIKVDSNKTPTRVKFYDKDFENELCYIEGTDMRNYGSGYEQYIPRDSSTGDNLSGRLLNVEVIYTGEDSFVLSGIQLQYRNMR